jgi:hypothetical protein
MGLTPAPIEGLSRVGGRVVFLGEAVRFGRIYAVNPTATQTPPRQTTRVSGSPQVSRCFPGPTPTNHATPLTFHCVEREGFPRARAASLLLHSASRAVVQPLPQKAGRLTNLASAWLVRFCEPDTRLRP